MSGKPDEGKTAQTKKAIEAAVISLLATTDLNKITVSEVVEAAHIARSTFYRYYDSVQDVATEMGDRILRSMAEINRWAAIERVDETSSRLTPSALNRMTYLYEHRAEVNALTGPHGDPEFLERASGVMAGYWIKRLERGAKTPVDAEFFTRFMAAGHNAVIIYWLKEHPEVPPEKVATFLNQAFYSLFLQTENKG